MDGTMWQRHTTYSFPAQFARHNPKLLKVCRKAAALIHPPIVLRRPAQRFGSVRGSLQVRVRKVRVQTRTLLYHDVMDEEVQRAKSQGHSLNIARSFAEFRQLIMRQAGF